MIKWNLNNNEKRTVDIPDAQTASGLSLDQDQDTVFFCSKSTLFMVGVKSLKIQEKLDLNEMVEAYCYDHGQSPPSLSNVSWINASLLPDIVFLASETDILSIYIPSSQLLKIFQVEEKMDKCQFFQFS